MEYVYYNLIILVLLAVILFIARFSGRSRLSETATSLANSSRQQKLRNRKSKQAARLEGSSGANLEYKNNPVIARELASVRTPWGWPGYSGTKGGSDRSGDVSDSMHRFADSLIRAKITVDDPVYQEKRIACLRALLEDRYGRASTMNSIDYHKIRAPRLRDPQAAHDQMDNFPNGKGDQLITKLKSNTRIKSTSAAALSRDAIPVNLKDMKTPWGW